MTVYTFTLKFDCEKCGEMVAVNGPAHAIICSSCQKQYSTKPASWGETICLSNGGSRTLGDFYRCKGYKTRQPRCPKCDKHFPFDEALVGHDTQIPCPHCDLAIQTFPAPEWLKQELPAVVQLVGADREGPDSSGVALDTNEQAPRPVMLNCPNCAAPLKITAEAERTMACEHCNVDVYLPDGVWRRLHPVHTVHPWSIVYEGKLETAQKRIERQNEEQREERLNEEGGRNAERYAAQQKRREEKKSVATARWSSLAWSSVGLSGVLLAIFAIWSWIIRLSTGANPLEVDTSEAYLYLGLAAMLSIFVATIFANRLINRVADNDFGWFLFVTWTWVPLSFVPVLGAIIALMRSYSLLVSGKIGEMTITENGMHNTYPAVTFTRGEGRPAGVLFLCLALFGQLTSVCFFYGWFQGLLG